MAHLVMHNIDWVYSTQNKYRCVGVETIGTCPASFGNFRPVRRTAWGYRIGIR